jgi:hypothetical protein
MQTQSVRFRGRVQASRRESACSMGGMPLDVGTSVAQNRATEGGCVLTIDVRALVLPRTRGRCPSCRGTNLGWFGILRVCLTCDSVFHWRDAASES